MQCLDLIEHQEQPRVARVLEDRQDALQKAQGTEVIDVALDAGIALHTGVNVGLACHPRQKTVGDFLFFLKQGLSVGTKSQ